MKSRGIWLKLLLALSMTIVFLGFIELVSYILLKTGLVQITNSRDCIDLVYDYDTIFFNKPNQTACGNFQKVRLCHYQTNRDGFREDEELPRTRKEDEYRIFCVGDSCTLGFWVDQHQTYPYQLQQILNQRAYSGKHYRVINGGCVGFTSFQVARLLERWLPVIKPEMVVFSAGYNDGTETKISDKRADYHRESFSGLMNLIRHTSFYTVIYELFISHKVEPVETGTILRVGVKDYGIALRYCVNLVRSQNAQIVFLPISVPSPYIDVMQQVVAEKHTSLINTEESLWRVYSQMAAGDNNYGGWVLDYIGPIGESFFDYAEHGETRSAEMRTKSFVFNDSIHPNPIGYRAIAEDLAQVIP